MSPRKTILAAAAAVLMLSTRAFSAILSGDINAMSGWNGTQNFDETTITTPVFTMKAEVDYAVYAPGQFNLSFPGMDPSGGARYVYAYRVHNTGTSTSVFERNPGFFTVGLDGGEQPVDLGYLDLNIGVDPNAPPPTPAYQFVPASEPYTSATWNFSVQIPKTQYSEVLLFTSPYGPEMDDASVQGGVSAQRRLPSPVPEPATALAACSLAAALLMRRRVPR